MLIVMDLSKKLVGYKLFQSFLYKFKNESNLVLVNDPLIEYRVDYDALRRKVQNILYSSHTSSFSLCVLYDRNEQSIDPFKNSLINNIHNLEEVIIKPLSIDYNFDKLYCISLDDVKKDLDGIPDDKNVRLATVVDSFGYIQEECDTKYKDILFTNEEIDSYDDIWNNINNKDISLENKILEFEKEFKIMFSNKIDNVNNRYSEYSWYSLELDKVYKEVLNKFRTSLYKNSDNLNNVRRVSEYIKESLKNNISTYKNRDYNFIHIDLNKNNYLNRGVSKYRHQIEILAFLIFLSTYDTKFLLGEDKYLGRENHWEFDGELSEEKLKKMLKSFIVKLKLEIDNIKKIGRNELDYQEFKLEEFNLPFNNKKSKSFKWFKMGLFYTKRDVGNLANYIDQLYERYLVGIKYANERLCDLTSILRTKRESSYTNKITEKIEILKLSLKLKEMKMEVEELEQEISLNQLKEVDDNSNMIRKEYEDIKKDIKKLIKKRISFRTFVINSILIIMTSICTYKILTELLLPIKLFSVIASMVLLLPLSVYVLIQYISLLSIKVKINERIAKVRKENDDIIFDLYSDDNKMVEFVKNTYKIIMMKKYINEYELKIKNANDEFKKIEYHREQLNSIYENTERLIQVLGINIDDVDIEGIDKINSLNIDKDIYSNELYCPLNYLSKIEGIENKVIINGEQKDVNGNLIGFVNAFNITYDKEYRHD